MNIEVLISRIQSLCNEKKISMTTAFIESGVGKNFKCNLKIANPSDGKITMLANYFGVSVAYLKGETDEKNSPPSEEDRLLDKAIELMKKLSPEEQAQAMKYLAFLADSSKKQ